MEKPIRRLHHVTATVNDAQEDFDFYTRLLGLRLVKKTVNFDNVGVYHFYYGDRRGTPGTIMTTFPYKGKNVRVGRKGTGQVTVTSFSIAPRALDFWKERLEKNGVTARQETSPFGEAVLSFDDPSGLILELVADERDERTPWHTDEIGAEHAIRGFHRVTLALEDPAPTRQLLQDVLGFELVGEQANRTRMGVEGGGPGEIMDLLHLPDEQAGVNGLGTVHHVALAIETDEQQLALRDQLIALGYNVTEVRDRKYFRSIYFREPGGVLLEVATLGPGFLVDEEEAALGRTLMLPPWEESNRTDIEAALPEIKS